MATMQFRVSNGEFINIVQALRRRHTTVEEIVGFCQDFMIDMENENILGFYDYELVVDEETIRLDANESEERLKKLVKSIP